MLVDWGYRFSGSTVIRDEVLFEAIDKLAPTIFALIVLLAIVDVPVFLVLE
jgi:hypothetical protein